jgi:hypothetical protein
MASAISSSSMRRRPSRNDPPQLPIDFDLQPIYDAQEPDEKIGNESSVDREVLYARKSTQSTTQRTVYFQPELQIRGFLSTVVKTLSSIFARTKSSSCSITAAPFPISSLNRFLRFSLLMLLSFPDIFSSYGSSKGRHYGVFVQGGFLAEGAAVNREPAMIRERDDTSTDVCKRWSQQSAIVNGTLYLYGGRASTDSSQTSDTWNNDVLTLPLTVTFDIASPTLKDLSNPSGPPPVANGFLWNSLTSLFLYGGEFSDNPVTSPSPFSLWEYDIASSSWSEHSNPQTSAGNNSDPANVAVQRAAEGAGLAVPELGRGWYFGGHLDGYTTEGWSQSTARVYLKSLLEFTFPGFTNDGIEDLAGGKGAGSDGVWRNITQGGLQEDAGFTERADGVLVYIPGWGTQGILIGMAGGTNVTFVSSPMVSLTTTLMDM